MLPSSFDLDAATTALEARACEIAVFDCVHDAGRCELRLSNYPTGGGVCRYEALTGCSP
jgi:hypothetical protein